MYIVGSACVKEHATLDLLFTGLFVSKTLKVG